MICAALGLDPLGTLASGALLVVVAQADAESMMQGVASEGIQCVEIGSIVARQQGLRIKTATGVQDLPRFQHDEVTKVL